MIDLHEDISYYYLAGGDELGFGLEAFDKDLSGRHADIPKFKKANVKLVFSSIFSLLPTISPRVVNKIKSGYEFKIRTWTPKAACLTALEHIKIYYRLIEAHSNDLMLVLNEEDVNEAIRGNKIGFLLSMEGAYALDDIDDLWIYYNLGVRCVGLTWNFDNRYAASCVSRKDYGLTDEGEELIREANKLGIIIDLAHASKKTHLEAAEVSKLPLINSHANPRRIHRTPRNVDDEMYEAIKRTGGIVGFMCELTGGKKDIEAYADCVTYVYENFGPDIIAIGTDYFGLIGANPPRGLEDITKFEKLFGLLTEKGMDEKDVEKFAYKNALRVILEHARRWKPRLSEIFQRRE